MKIILLILMISGTISRSIAQSPNIATSHQFSVIHLPEYYIEKGVIFSKDYEVVIEMRNLQSRYTPTNDDIKKAENIFNQKYTDPQKTNVDTKKYFCRWARQYIGLIDINGNKNIVMQLVDNTKPRKINRLLGKNWEIVFATLLSDEFYKVSTRFRVNIDKEEVSNNL